jgi:hypothetical protein
VLNAQGVLEGYRRSHNHSYIQIALQYKNKTYTGSFLYRRAQLYRTESPHTPAIVVTAEVLRTAIKETH